MTSSAAAEVLALRAVVALRRRGVPAGQAVRTAATALPSLAPIADALERGAAPAPTTMAERALAKGDALPVDDLAALANDAAKGAALREQERRSERPFVVLLTGVALLGCAAAWVAPSLVAFAEPETLPGITLLALSLFTLLRFAGLPLAIAVVIAHRRGWLARRLPGERSFAILAALRTTGALPVERGALDEYERAFAERIRGRKGDAAAARALADAIEADELPRALWRRRAVLIAMAIGAAIAGLMVLFAMLAPIFTLASAVG